MAEPARSAPLDDVMMAMDVVDGIRHDERLALRELDEEARREELVTRLRRIYDAQGIAVPDSVIAEGVAALDEQRFVHTPAPLTWRTLLARAWIWRARIAAGVAVLLIALGTGWFAYDASVLGPRRAIVEEAQATFTAITGGEVTPEAAARAQGIVGAVEAALARGDTDAARTGLAELVALRANLPLVYELRIVEAISQARANAPHIRDHAFVVEAIGADGGPVTVTITDADGATRGASRFALPVSQDTYTAIQRDERGSGTLADVAPLAVKRAGEPAPDYRVPVTGAPMAPREG